MWRSSVAAWQSIESTQLPDGMHKHEVGAYFKTPSNPSATSEPIGVDVDVASETIGSSSTMEANSGGGGRSGEQPHHSGVVLEGSSTSSSMETSGGAVAKTQRRTRFKQPPASVAPISQPQTTSTNQTTTTGKANFRSRLSSISGALHVVEPKQVAKRLLSGSSATNQMAQQQRPPVRITTTSIDSPTRTALERDGSATETTEQNLSSIAQSAGATMPVGSENELGGSTNELPMSHETRPSTSSRRLSQLFLPQLGHSPSLLLNQMQDPYAPSELIPPHLLGLFGQPPLVGGVAAAAAAAATVAGSNAASGSCTPLGVGAGAGQHRASWADVTLFGRLSNVRPSVDSTFGAHTARHSFDARKYAIALDSVGSF